VSRQQVHAQVRLRLLYATDSDLKEIGRKLERLGMDRNAASYDLRSLVLFTAPAGAQAAVKTASDALALLDTLDTNPVRRAAAAAAIKP
jgi:hypothetical protein